MLSLQKTRIIIIIDCFVFLFCLLGIYHNIQKAGFQADYHITFINKDDRVIVKSIKDQALKAFFTEGDIILYVQDISIHNKNDIEFISDGLSVNDKIKFLTISKGVQNTFTTDLPPYYGRLYLIIQSIVSIFFLILGVITISQKPESLSARIWHWASICAAIIISCTWGNYTSLPFGLGYFLRVLFFAAYTFVPVLFLHLCLSFPRRKTDHLQNIIYPLYILSALLFVAESTLWLMAAESASMQWFRWLFIPFNINRIFFTLLMLGGIALIIHSYRNAQQEFERKQLRWLLFGLAIGPPSFVLFWQTPQVFGYDALIAEEFIVFIMMAVPITFYIAIIKHHIFDINLIISRSTVYVFVVALLFIVYGSLVGLTALFLGKFNIETSLISSIAAAILTPVFFEPVRRYFNKVVDKAFFRVQYNYRLAQRRITMELEKTVDKKKVARLIMELLDELMKPAYFAFYLKKNNKWSRIAGKNDNLPGNMLTELDDIAQKTNQYIITSAYNVEDDVDIEDLNKYNHNEYSGCLGLPFRNQSNEILGILILGSKKSAKKFNSEDTDLLKTIAIQVGLAIEKIELQQKLLIKGEETERLRELNELKSYFVSSVSHDLQTPLTSIKMFAELLREKENISTDEKNEFLEIIKGESDRLSRLINNVLDFSKVERGAKEYSFTNINLVEIVKEVMGLMEYQFKYYSFSIQLNVHDQDLTINADKDALQSAFINILSNSIKYSDKIKEIKVDIIKEKTTAVIRFMDKGVGINKKDQQKIFDTFFRSSDEKVKSMGGAGLGLTLVNHVVKSHNGGIAVESEAGKGSVFTLTFPLYSGIPGN